MNDQINGCQIRLFNKLFATLPSIRRSNEFEVKSDLDFKVNHFYYFNNKDFWFTNDKTENKFYFLFGVVDKPIKDIQGKDICLIIDFDKDIRFNDDSLGLFGFKNSGMHILINNKILKERYPNIDVTDFNITNFKSFDRSFDLEIIDLGSLNGEFINNIRKLIKKASLAKTRIPKLIKTDSFGNKNTINQMNIILEDLANGKNENEAILHANVSENTYRYWINRGKQEFGEIYLQFYKHVNEFKSGKNEGHNKESTDVSENEKANLVDESIYEPLLEEYEDLFDSMNQTGIAWVTKTKNNWNYSRNINGETINLSADTVIELYEKVTKRNLIWGIRDYNKAKKFIDIPDDFEIPLDSQIDEINVDEVVDPGIYAPLSEEYEKSFSSMNQIGIAWVNQIGNKFYYVKSIRGKNIRLSGENIYDLYEKVKNANQIWGIRDYDRAKEFIDIPDDFEIPLDSQTDEINEIVEFDPDIYAPLPAECEKLFNHTPMNKSGIAWVTFIGKRWVYSRKDSGKTVKFDDESIYVLHNKVKEANQIWGIRDYDRAKEFIDIPDDFEIPLDSQIDEINVDEGVDPGIYAPLSEEYEKSFSSMNQSGIAWVNQIGSKWYYVKSNHGKNVRLSSENIYDLYEKVKKANQIWGIRDYSKARLHIHIPHDFEIPKKQEEEIVVNAEIDESIYSLLSQDHISKFNPNPNNRTGIAWVNKLGSKWVYQRQRNGKIIRFYSESIYGLYEKVKNANQIWGILDIEKAQKTIETNSIVDKIPNKSLKSSNNIINDSKVTVNYLEKSTDNLEILIRGTIRNEDLFEVLIRFELFKENINRIITNSINNESDIFLELEINKKLLPIFEEKIEDLDWKINK